MLSNTDKSKGKILHVSSTTFLVNKKRPTIVHYGDTTKLDLRDWKQVSLEFTYQKIKPSKGEIYYKYNSLKGAIFNEEELHI